MFETLGLYRILEFIGAGGIGDVYRGRDTRLGRTVAIKVANAAISRDAARREQFLSDARAAALLSHPSIAALYEIGEDQNQLFLAFEYVPGETLHAAMAGRPMNPKLAIDYGVQIADALADAHAAGVVHGDLKPDNVMVTPKGRVKLLDFGLAAWTNGGAERRRAAEQATDVGRNPIGTAAYLSPEQALGERTDYRTDIFSLGVLLFEMLTGRLPFDKSGAVPLQVVQAAVPAPSSVNAAVPRELDPIVLKAVAKSLDQRYDAAAALAADLRDVAAILDQRATAAERLIPPPARGSRRPWLWATLAVAVAVLLVWLAWRL